MAFAFSAKYINRLISLIQLMDKKSKSALISKINSINTFPEENKNNDLSVFFGKWEDSRTSDEIISSIKEERVEKKSEIKF